MTYLYIIRDWDKHFENNRSRQIDRLAWVSVPNRHDGENYSKLMVDAQASILFSAWILLVQIASKCTPRGTLVKGDGTPHTAESLTLKCRCPENWMSTALVWFPEHTDWIEVKEFTDERQSGVSRASVGRQSGDAQVRRKEGGKGEEGMDRSVELPEGFPNTEQEAVQACSLLPQIPEGFVRTTWNLAMGRNGMDSKGIAIRRWSNHVKAQFDYSQNSGFKNNGKPSENTLADKEIARLQRQADRL